MVPRMRLKVVTRHDMSGSSFNNTAQLIVVVVVGMTMCFYTTVVYDMCMIVNYIHFFL